MLRFKFHQHRTINEEFDFGGGGGKILLSAPRGAGGPDYKNHKIY